MTWGRCLKPVWWLELLGSAHCGVTFSLSRALYIHQSPDAAEKTIHALYPCSPSGLHEGAVTDLRALSLQWEPSVTRGTGGPCSLRWNGLVCKRGDSFILCNIIYIYIITLDQIKGTAILFMLVHIVCSCFPLWSPLNMNIWPCWL